MWPLLIILIVLLPVSINGLNSLNSHFAIEYFKYRDVKFICLLVCEGDSWIRDFTKESSRQFMRVSSAIISKSSNNQNNSKLELCMKQKLVSIGLVIDPKCDDFEKTMYYASENTMLDTTHKWLVLINNDKDEKHITEKNDDIKDMLHIIGKLNISVDSDIILATKEGPNYFQVHEVYNFGKIQGGDLIIKKSGTWSSSKGFETNLNDFKYYRRWNFYQWPLKMISVVSPVPKIFDPNMLTEPNPTVGVPIITKTSVSILKVISEIHNLRFEHSLADRWLGDYSKNNSQVVVASALYYRQQDISPIIRFIKDVYDKIDIVHPPLTSIETKYYYRIPTYGAGKFENQFLRPLSSGAWLCVVAVIVMCALVLLISAKLERRPSSSQYAVFSVLASICQQFFEDNVAETGRVSIARKLTILVTGISCVLIYNYYTSSVVSWLLSGPPPSINSLQELLDSPLELIFEDIGYTRSWLQTPTYYYNKRNAKIEDELRKKKVFNKREGAPLLENLEVGIKMVKAGGYAYHTEVDSASRLISRTFTQSELCELGSLQSMEKTQLYACVQKNSPYKEFLVWSLIRLLERGIVRCIQHRTRSPSVQCEGSSPRALALGGAAPAFLLLAGGYLLAIVILFIERKIWIYKRRMIL